MKIQVLLFINDRFREEALFPSVFYILEFTFKPLSFTKNGLIAPFPVTQAETITKFFSSYHTHFSTERLFLNLSAKAPALFVCLSCVSELIMVVFKRLNGFNPFLLIICLTEVRLIPVFFFLLTVFFLYRYFFSWRRVATRIMFLQKN